jgi:hypothetical protein
MPPSITHGLIPSSGSSTADRCAFYRQQYRLPAALHNETRIVLLVSGLTGAITMPVDLGRRVLAGLRVRMLAGPVVAHPPRERWTFLTGPGHPPSGEVAAELLRLRATVAVDGDAVVLPSPVDERLGLWQWENHPNATSDFPPLSAVISTARSMAATTA